MRKKSMMGRMASIFLFTFFLLSVFFITWRSKHVDSNDSFASIEPQIPTIFVHGYKGTMRSFQHMLHRFEYDYRWGTKSMVIRVDRMGIVHISGTIPQNLKNPFIQIVFEENRTSIEETANSLKKAMRLLKENYSVDELYIVAHSMGGLVSTKYIEDTNNLKDYPIVRKMVVIGSPFQGIEQESYHKLNTGKAIIDLKPDSHALLEILNNRDQFSKKTKVLNIAGINPEYKDSDGVVSIQSALSARNIVPLENYHEIIVKDKLATHSGLHEHPKVDKYIGEFLWGYN